MYLVGSDTGSPIVKLGSCSSITRKALVELWEISAHWLPNQGMTPVVAVKPAQRDHTQGRRSRSVQLECLWLGVRELSEGDMSHL